MTDERQPARGTRQLTGGEPTSGDGGDAPAPQAGGLQAGVGTVGKIHARLDSVTDRMGGLEDMLASILQRLNIPTPMHQAPQQPAATLTSIDRLNADQIYAPGGVKAAGGAEAVGLHYKQAETGAAEDTCMGLQEEAQGAEGGGRDDAAPGGNPEQFKEPWDFNLADVTQEPPFPLNDITSPPRVQWSAPNMINMTPAPEFPMQGTQAFAQMTYVASLVAHLTGSPGALKERQKPLWIPAPTYGKQQSVYRGFWSKHLVAPQGTIDLRGYIHGLYRDERLLFMAIRYLLAQGTIQQQALSQLKGVTLFTPGAI